MTEIRKMIPCFSKITHGWQALSGCVLGSVRFASRFCVFGVAMTEGECEKQRDCSPLVGPALADEPQLISAITEPKATWAVASNLLQRVSIRTGYDALRIFLSLVLLVAAGLKAYQLATEPTIGDSILDSRWLLMASVEFDIFFGIWLLSNNLPKITWAAAIGCFTFFTCISFYKALSGYATCGYFGHVKITPWYTATSDFAIVLSLLCCRPKRKNEISSILQGKSGLEDKKDSYTLFYHSMARILAFWLSFGVIAAYEMCSYSDTTLSDAGDILGDGQIIVLHPQNWLGKQLPILGHINIGDQLKEGEWLVVLYHHDCPRCEEVIRSALQISQTLGIQQVGLIEIPPYGSLKAHIIPQSSMLTRGRLSNTREWFAETPVILTMKEGYVTAIDENGSLSVK